MEDEGPGIEASEHSRLLERFYSRGNDQGAGLGLAIVKRIADRLGGQISLENRPQGGMRATLDLPCP
ncbi:Globin-coupled histidine kinase [compost metagenome]